ncbi:SDR family NAD(P)-dependent oxidoreductase [Aliarcobacter butzleri]|uniref:SDR family NAD(P)-dependent oxidoreductase n=1 Tax=Aliarcobacter butzleri TaxID=28197 RepID=UPI001EDA2468|nr:SDR family oxidoreductase [Aliarcobacter butzleri]MCG3688103.1 SDR family oxidoreductase [Aliarcobacter butzleri]MCG3697876.1 SDR family oxidoreductase [Aliarcobacter butzleri]MCG3699884.1 SDR family oxidoreductase [Aliarcobacter butzleri]MCT7620073.1 SDR family oxidoreductase [Aliarcobacter butzleri]MDN5080566.1 SDR family NAD(P)-dependent oxidoreductase [Aliarcobacter butzleri]
MNKIILITGTSKGIGKTLANYYLEKDFIVVGCSRGKSSVNHQNYRHFSLEVGDEKAVVSMVKTIKKEFGKIDILINNAGIASMNHILTTSVETISKLFNTNFLGTFLFTREVSKVMMKEKFGRIINFTTVAKPLRLEGEAIYASSKAAIETFTQTASKELSPFNITVNAIGPTPIQTDLIKAVPKDKIDELLNKQTIKRFGEFEDIINVIDFFINEKSSFITGQIIYLGGVNN